MPVDNTGKTPAVPRRAPRRPMTEEEQKDIELKRLRGELSCAECRRLKLKCDKSVPCGSCVRRGCESICPCGILSAGQGTRFILADTDQLHAKIAEMSQRIRQLEEALAILQGVVSAERHPLLAADLLGIKFAAEAPKRTKLPDTEQEQAIDALGTLTLGDSGEVKYFGRSAGTETLLLRAEADDNSDDEDEDLLDALSPISPEIAEMGDVFPSGRPDDAKLQHVQSLLPSYARAVELSELYILHAALFFRPMKRDELLGPFLQSIYGPTENADTNPHALASLFFVLALASLLDLRLEPYNAEAEYFYGAGRAALGLRAVYNSPLVDTVRAIGLMSTYHTLAGKKYTRDSAWCLMSIAAKLAQSTGLHRDPARWHMDPKTVQSRRNLFWEVFACDLSHSLALGRPPSIHLSYVDCEYPEDQESTLGDLGEVRPGFWRSKYQFARDIWMAMAEATLAAKTPGYATVLELDRRVRELSVSDAKPYTTRADGEEAYFSSSESLRGCYASQYRTVTMIYLHRSFFAQAMLDFPANPLRSPFATSFLTAYRSASVVIKATAHQFDRCADMAVRVWFLLHQTFSAAVIVGTVVTLSPKASIAGGALLDLSLAVELFERTATRSHRGKLALSVLRRLKDRAVRAYSQHASLPQPTAGLDPADPRASNVTDGLALFGGQTRVLALKQKHKRGKSVPPRSPGTGSGRDSASPSPVIPGGMSPGTIYTTSVLSSPGASVIAGAAGGSGDLSWLDDIALNPYANVNTQMDMDMSTISPELYSMLYSAGTDAGAQAVATATSIASNSMPPMPVQFEEMEMYVGAPSTFNGGVGGGGMNAAGAMVELGLSSESGMDAAWLSFIQQAGVSLSGTSPPANSLFD